MSKPEKFDVVELLVDLPEEGLMAGNQGSIVELYDDAFEVEFTNGEGEPLALLPLTKAQFVVVWRSESKSWVSMAEKVESLMAALPEEALAEGFDFVRNAYSRRLAG